MMQADRQTPSVARTLALVGTLYVSQGIPMGLAFIAMPAILRSQGTSLEEIGLLGLILIPWAIKFLWAPVVDRLDGGRLGPRRSWIVPAQLVLVGIYVLLALLPDMQSSLNLLFALLLIANVVSATQDIATDGLAVEALRTADLGWANGLQIGGFSLGMIIGGAVTVIAYEHSGWTTSFLALAGAMLLTMVPLLMTPEHRRDREAQSLRSRPSLANFLRRPGSGVMLVVAATFYFCTTLVSAMKGAFLIDAGLSVSEAGIVGGTASAAIAIAGAALGSLLVHRFGARAVALYGGAASALLLALWIGPTLSMSIDLQTAIAIAIISGVASGIAYVGFFTIFMTWASPEQAGTDFTILQCTESLTNIAASVLAGQIAGSLGFIGLFGVAPVAGLAVILFLALLLSRGAQPGVSPYPNVATSIE